MQLKKYWYSALFILLLCLFCYFRLKPILLQTVPYTFDQGRDFLRVQSIVRDYDIAVFGPPAGGLNGLSHGVWWYYELIIPYIVGGANPIAYSYFIFFVNTVSVLLFAYFLKKHFNALTSLFFLAILAGSPYFILSSFFPINSVMTIPFILLLYYAFYMVVKEGKPIHVFLTALSAGFIFEAEVPFGLFLYPALIITLLFTKTIRTLVSTKKKAIALLLGFLFPFIPRILAELVSGLRQTKALIAYFGNSAEPVDKNANLFLERTKLFWEYYLSIFPEKNGALAITILLLILVGLYSALRVKNKVMKTFALFSLILPSSLFMLSQLSNKQLFWANYFEGIQYMLIMPIVISVYFLSSSKYFVYRILAVGALGLFILVPSVHVYKDSVSRTNQLDDGNLRRHIAVIDELKQQSDSEPICLRIYTPPVIPHTYNYLFDYYERAGYTKPSNLFLNKECYYIFEKDQDGYEFRTEQWRKENIPLNATQTLQKNVTKDVYIERWSEPAKK